MIRYSFLFFLLCSLISSCLIVQRASALPKLGDSASALFVAVDTGKVVYSHQADVLRAPASTLKLVTTAASLAELPHESPFTTKLFSLEDGKIGVQAGLDPTLTVERVWLMLKSIAASNSRVAELVIDEGALLDGAGDARSVQAYHAAISAFPLSFNSLVVTVCANGVRASKAKVPVTRLSVEADPPVAQVEGSVTVVSEGTSAGIRLSGEGDDRLQVSGSVAEKKCSSETWALQNRQRSVAIALQRLGALAGVRIEKVSWGKIPRKATLLREFSSLPLQQIVTGMNLYSTNGTAEMLRCRLGAMSSGDFSCERGLGRLEALLQRASTVFKGSIRDGSGLSKENRVSAQNLVDVLLFAQRQPWAGVFEGSLPLAGETGTLGKRKFSKNSAVRAKTGSIAGVSTIAGYAGTTGKVAFAILMSGSDLASAHRDQERLVDAVLLQIEK